MKRFSVPCDFGGKQSPFHVYIGEPNPKNHPLHFQAEWLSKERGGTIPPQVMDSFDKLHKISIEQGVSFEELCVYALGAAAEENEKKKKKTQHAGAQAGAAKAKAAAAAAAAKGKVAQPKAGAAKPQAPAKKPAAAGAQKDAKNPKMAQMAAALKKKMDEDAGA